MSGQGDPSDGEVPWPQRLLDNIWLLAIAALAFWALSYVAWGLIDVWGLTG